MVNKKKKIVVFDAETSGSFGYPLIYDIGIVIADKAGRIYEEKSFVIDEIFNNRGYMQNAYYSKKIPQYLQDIRDGTRQVVSFQSMKESFHELLRKYEVKEMYAYNFPFDGRALTSTAELILKDRVFFPEEFNHIKRLCIWTIACESIFSQTKFIKTALEKGWVSEKGNVFTTAETAYRYLTGIDVFEESHTGVEDCKIELAILVRCVRQKMKFSGKVIYCPWRIPNRKRKEIQKKNEEKKELQKNDNIPQES